MNKFKLINALNNLSFLEYIDSNEFVAVWRLSSTDIELRWYHRDDSLQTHYWMRTTPCKYQGISFDELLLMVPDHIKDDLIFNMDLFRKFK